MKNIVHLSILPLGSSREKDHGVVPSVRKLYCVFRGREMGIYSIAGRANLYIMSIKSIGRMISLL